MDSNGIPGFQRILARISGGVKSIAWNPVESGGIHRNQMEFRHSTGVQQNLAEAMGEGKVLHLLCDPKIQASLSAMQGHIKVETPFNVNKFESMHANNPNQPFVQSVMTGLQEGFWPLDDGEWKVELEEIIDNYSTDEGDLDAIRSFCAFCDKERSAERWSDELSHSELLPGMKISPMSFGRMGKPVLSLTTQVLV